MFLTRIADDIGLVGLCRQGDRMQELRKKTNLSRQHSCVWRVDLEKDVAMEDKPLLGEQPLPGLPDQGGDLGNL